MVHGTNPAPVPKVLFIPTNTTPDHLLRDHPSVSLPSGPPPSLPTAGPGEAESGTAITNSACHGGTNAGMSDGTRCGTAPLQGESTASQTHAAGPSNLNAYALLWAEPMHAAAHPARMPTAGRIHAAAHHAVTHPLRLLLSPPGSAGHRDRRPRHRRRGKEPPPLSAWAAVVVLLGNPVVDVVASLGLFPSAGREAKVYSAACCETAS